MKRNIITLKAAGLLAIAVLASTGCVKENKMDNQQNGIPPKETYFGFETRTSVQFTVNYGVPGLQALFKIYAENPLKYNDGTLTLKEGVEPVYTAYTDVDGKFEGKITLPAAVKHGYLYTDRWGVASCVALDFSTGSASYDALTGANKIMGPSSSDADIAAWFTGNAPYDIAKIPTHKDTETGFVYTISKWTTMGRIIGANPAADVYMTTKLENGAKVSDISNRAQAYLRTLPLGEERASMLIKDPSIANITTQEAGTKLQVVFLSDMALYTNTFGYYYYQKSKANLYDYTSSPNYWYDDMRDLKKFIVFPHAATEAISSGTTVSLKFFGPNGDKAGTTDFPAGYVVGWFMIPNGFVANTENTLVAQYGIVDGCHRPCNPRSSIWGAMMTSNDPKASTDFRRFISLNDVSSKSVVIGIEDIRNERNPDDYCDMSFIVTSNKEIGGDKPEIPDVPETPADDTSFKGTLAFEDIWPYGGDYDMNDVVVEYSWVIKFDKENNVTALEETYTPVHDGAKLRSLFAYELPYGTAETVPTGASVETSTNSIIIDKCVKDCLKESFVIKRTFSTKVSKEQLIAAFNPYIIVNDANKGQGRKEVHLPKHLPTNLADKSLNYTQDDAYYMKKDGKYPFAINIPIVNFKVAPETIKIDVAYSSFRSWADSHGKQDNDWYLKK